MEDRMTQCYVTCAGTSMIHPQKKLGFIPARGEAGLLFLQQRPSPQR